MGMRGSFLVVVHQINVERVTVNQAENNPTVARYRNAPQAPKVALEGVKAVARQVEVGCTLRSIQVTKNVRDSARLIGTDLARVPLVEAFQTPVSERPYHQNTVPCIGTDINQKVPGPLGMVKTSRSSVPSAGQSANDDGLPTVEPRRD
jgi:hypothetical protein